MEFQQLMLMHNEQRILSQQPLIRITKHLKMINTLNDSSYGAFGNLTAPVKRLSFSGS